MSQGYRVLEVIDVLAAAVPSLEGGLLTARIAGHGRVSLDGTWIRADHSMSTGRTQERALWWLGG